MGSILEASPVSLSSPDEPRISYGRRLSIVAEEEKPDLSGRPLELSPGTSLEDDSDEHASQQRSPKRQRKGFACEACRMNFTEKRALARHRKTDHHRKQLGLPPDRKHACNVCGKFFTRGHDLKRHKNEQHVDAEPASLPMDLSTSGSEPTAEQSSSEEPSSSRSVSQASTTSTDITALTALTALTTIPTNSTIPRMSPGYAPSTAWSSPPSVREENFRIIKIEEDPKPGSDLSEPRHATSVTNDSPNAPATYSDPPTIRSDSDAPCEIDTPSDGTLSVDRANGLPDPRPARRMHSQHFDVDPGQSSICVLCNCAYEDDPDELLKHLRWHLDSFKGQYPCKLCEIDFVHKEDLEKHLHSAAQGHCGFNFPHQCTGHHPPAKENPTGEFSDYDRARLCVQLQNWEQAQLQAYMVEINDLTTSRQNRRLTRWSDVLGASRRDSFASFAISINSYASAPCDVPSSGKTDIGGLQKRLQHMSLGSARSRVKRLVQSSSSSSSSSSANSSSDLRVTANNLDRFLNLRAAGNNLDRSLQKAMKHNDINKVERLLQMGADSTILHDNKGPFTAMALWGLGHISGLLAEHRLDEDIVGSCPVCKLSTESFSQGSHRKVSALLRHGANPNQPGGLCGFPLATAAWLGKPDVTRLLLQHGADVQKRGGRYGTALCAAAAESGFPGQRDALRVLLKHGADVLEKDPEGNTPLDLARQRRDHWVMKLMDLSGSEEETRGRIPCCDEVIRILQEAERVAREPILRPSRSTEGIFRGEVGSGSKLTSQHSASSGASAQQPGVSFLGYWKLDNNQHQLN